MILSRQTGSLAFPPKTGDTLPRFRYLGVITNFTTKLSESLLADVLTSHQNQTLHFKGKSSLLLKIYIYSVCCAWNKRKCFDCTKSFKVASDEIICVCDNITQRLTNERKLRDGETETKTMIQEAIREISSIATNLQLAGKTVRKRGATCCVWVWTKTESFFLILANRYLYGKPSLLKGFKSRKNGGRERE